MNYELDSGYIENYVVGYIVVSENHSSWGRWLATYPAS